MIETWYGILAFMLIIYVVLDGRNFGAGILHLFVARAPDERAQIFAAVAPVYAWHEVWLIGFGGVLFMAFPTIYASSFSGYYLALFLILWCFILRGIALEVRGAFADSMWQAFWDAVFAFSNVLLAILFGAALGNLLRGLPIDAQGNFPMAFFTDFGVRGYVGLLDWYTISVSIMALVILAAHGANYLVLRTDGPVHDRCEIVARRLWSAIPVLFILITLETWYVRPQLFAALVTKPASWLGILIVLVGLLVLLKGMRRHLESKAFAGSTLLIAGLLTSGAVALFPVILYSTLAPANSLTIYNSASSLKSLTLALIWWPMALLFSIGYFAFTIRYYAEKVLLSSIAPKSRQMLRRM